MSESVIQEATATVETTDPADVTQVAGSTVKETGETTVQPQETQVAESKEAELGEKSESSVESFLNETLEEETEPSTQPTDPEDQVPEEYTFEGLSGDVSYSNEDKGLVSDLGKELKLTNRQAKALLEKGGAVLNKYRTMAVDKQTKIWYDQVKNDEVLGRNNFGETKKNVAAALKHYGSPALKKFLADSRIGNHPDVVKFFNAIGKDLREDSKFAEGGAVKSKQKYLDVLYNNSPKLK